MKNILKICFCSALVLFTSLSFLKAQDQITLKFTGKDQYNEKVKLYRILVENTNKRWQEVLYYPDTTLNIGSTGLTDYANSDSYSKIQLYQNTPNPFDGVTNFSLQLSEKCDVLLEIYDLSGKLIANYQSSHEAGLHLFKSHLSSPQTYLLNATANGNRMHIKMVNTGHGGENSIEYAGVSSSISTEINYESDNSKGGTMLPFTKGDKMQYTGYAHLAGTEFVSEVISKNQYNSETVSLTFNLPLPSVVTNSADEITGTSARLNGTVTDNHGYAITEKGFEYALSGEPYETIVASGSGSDFSVVVDSLLPNRQYQFRAYATSEIGTKYGNAQQFATPILLPEITLNSVSNVSSSSVSYSGAVVTDGGSTPTSRGVCWSSHINPTITDDFISNGSGLGDFSGTLYNLTSNTTYYIRAYATNSLGTAYSNELNFTTLQTSLPTVTTDSVRNIQGTTALGGGNVINNGGSTITARGICWSTNQNPTLSDSHTTDGIGTGSFTSNLTDLSLNTVYYVRAYATNSVGTAYGNQLLFTVPAILATVATSPINNIEETTATSGGNVTADGGASVIARGVCWSTSQNPTIADSYTTNGTGMGSFTSNIIGLTGNTTYYVRAYATNSVGTTYGAQDSFTTLFACGTSTITDVDSNTYNTVQIGQQCWMRENLKTTHYADGTSISNYYFPNNDSSNIAAYGCLYSWSVVMRNSSSSSSNPSGVQGICPIGWHIPSEAEWTQLYQYIQNWYGCNNSYLKLAKALASTEGWNSSTYTCSPGNNPSSNNATGFSALPAGYCEDSNYWKFHQDVRMWSSTQSNTYSSKARYIYLYHTDVHFNFDEEYKYSRYSVRCLKNNNATLPTITTTAVIGITQSTATGGGNVTSDGGTSVTERGVCWSTSPNPTISDSHTSDGTGTGSFTSNIIGLTASTTYYVRAYATNSAGTAYGTQQSFTTSAPSSFTCGTSTITDYDGNSYNTVQIGQQCWMKENLKTTHYADGTSISLGSSTSTTTAYRYYPNNEASNVTTYGYLYNWPAVMHNSSSSSSNPNCVQGICPTGWHVPSDAEWTQLTNYISSQSQYVCGSNNSYIAKAFASTTGWSTYDGTCCVGNNPSTNNATGFSAVPAGYYYVSYGGFGDHAAVWSATLYDASNAYYRDLIYYGPNVSRSYCYKDDGLSVRCLRDEGGTTANLPTVTTSSVNNITQTSATCGGNVTSNGGAMVTACGICWSTSQNPTISDSHTSDGTGTGIFTSNITGLTASTTYYVRAYATNSVGTAYGTQQSFTTNASSSFTCGTSTITDYDGNSYNTVQIGQQCWMKENLKTTHYANGTSINKGSTYSLVVAYRYYPNNDSNNVATYSYLYNWKAVMGNSTSSSSNPSGVQGICPNGWHVPSAAEWTQLSDYVSNQSQYVCGSENSYIAKALASTTGWNSSSINCTVGNNPSSNNSTGFSAVPAGRWDDFFFYRDLGYYADYWTCTSYGSSTTSAYFRAIDYNSSIVYPGSTDTHAAFSVRCVKD